ncbi:conserved hypothetical protein [Beutenbergia cavernae DSM 12333]|uniref:NUDIX hydrolase n=1 Tax=Beutenbergia cavernae (strain ATCC BAA-8 / DSM 12333 / CCUG 43141 / JCM 11478 / NBRC 16432 / NCIMB 13614 / HKI 0122) TaxID=471853 RepID=C5C5P8_BEUC1|nr:hypothetical protein [Beutenbergia cavernae]ACQ80239.1 conserved hypothetical protein [Beutenbergia cavernae DSM 12333]
MTTEVMIAIAVGLVLVLVWVAIGAANRLDRLHQKVARTGATLDAQLLRRAAAAAELAATGRLDPASSLVVAEAAARALEVGQSDDDDPLTPERGLAESELSRALRQALGVTGPAQDGTSAPDDATSTLEQCWHRSQLARRFYNDAVAQARRMRVQVVVRALHLAGRARMPVTFEMDDATER